MQEKESAAWGPLLASFLAVLVLKAVLLGLWGERPPLFDEGSYLAAADAVEGWLRAGAPTDNLDPAGRLAWHNPAYSTLVAAAALMPGSAALWMRLLQLAASLVSGLLLFRFLRPRAGRSLALAGALVLWLHPSMLFYSLTLWPVTLATFGTTALLFAAGRYADHPDDPKRQLELGLTIAPLPFFASPALLLLPAIAAWTKPRSWSRTVLPGVALWLAWTLPLATILGSWTAIDLAGPRNAALGNTEWVRDGRGSLWGDPEGKAVFMSKLEDTCGATMDIHRVRCEVLWCKQEAIAWTRAHPASFGTRALLRLGETWLPDTFLPRHLQSAVAFPNGPPEGLVKPARVLLAVVQAALLVAVILMGWAARRQPLVKALVVGVIVWTIPIVLVLGNTRLRQPLLPWIIAGAALVAARAIRPPERPR